MKAKLIVHTGQKGGEGSGNFGHAGRPGEVGGSVVIGRDVSDLLVKRANEFANNDEHIKEAAEQIAAKRIAGLTYNKLYSIATEWLDTSTGSMNAVKLQEAASRVFNIPISGGLESELAKHRTGTYKVLGITIQDKRIFDNNKAYDDSISAIYAHTQSKLRDMKLKPAHYVTVYRGVTKSYDVPSPLESYSLNAEVAKRFTGLYGGRMQTKKVLLKNILSVGGIGLLGGASDAEVVVIGR